MSERSAIMAEFISAMAKHDNARVIEIFASSFNGYCYFAYEVLLNTSMQVLNMSMKDINEAIVIDEFGTQLAYSIFMNILCFTKSSYSENHPAWNQIIQIYKNYRDYLRDFYNNGIPRIIIAHYLHKNFDATPDDIDEFIKMTDTNPGEVMGMNLKLREFVAEYFDKVDKYCLKFLNKEMSMKDIDGISKQVRFMDGIMSQSGGKMSDV